jgi:4-methoxybenzoate monooxygenase (O-demethylating)
MGLDHAVENSASGQSGKMPPVLTADPFSPEVLVDPYPFYEVLREAGAVVHLPQYNCWAIGRYADVQNGFNDWETYSSAAGVGLTNIRKEKSWREPSILQDADPPSHLKARTVLNNLMSPPAIRALRDQLAAEATSLVDRLITQGSFDAVEDFAEFYPARVFGDAIGIPREGRENLIRFGNVAFNVFGPQNFLFKNAMEVIPKIAGWITQSCKRESLRPGSIGAKLFESVDTGAITEHEGELLVRTFLVAGTDTVVNSLGNMIYCFVHNPDQWALLRADASLVRRAYEEVIRLEAPIQTFFRTTARDTIVDGVWIPEGEKVYLSYASGNRDPRRWSNADKFDIRRNNAGL